ncbi:GNAT family N-acetyltransferase [Morganella morganii]|uniref:GNAT family N-acetyltransferase n=1 Tax=Morganella morganii TaxID=582 RepID=UPI0015F50C47|nr:GNAT family N-acetyltransferase [Morganella morganii]MBA5806485.1 GNAT family N-acetyltransferase [Morganella morganii]
MIRLCPVSKDNREACIDLEVREDQEDFVASNVYSLAQLQFVNNFSADVIYDDDVMIGFAMYGIDDDGMFWIWRFMPDAKFQGKGLGKAAFTALLEKITAMNNTWEQPLPRLRLSYEPENEYAKHFYQRFGFNAVQMMDCGEEMAQLPLS